MKKPQKEKIKNENGIYCEVLNLDELDFTNAKLGIKCSLTKVIRALGGEKIVTTNKEGLIEAVYIAKENDAIFVNSNIDKYVPRDDTGNTFKFNEVNKYGYEIVESKNDYLVVRSNNKALLLVEEVKKPTCKKNGWGKDAHLFLIEGATLKKDIKTGQITGIEKTAFLNTWLILDDVNK